MTDTQLYIAISVPMLFALIGVMWISLSRRFDDLDKRLTKVEIKLGIQP